MSLFDYTTPNKMEILVWAVDEHGFVEVELVNMEI